MRDAINSPAWGILDDWRAGGAKRAVSVHRTPNGYLLWATDDPLAEHRFCQEAGGLGACASALVRAIETKRGESRRAEIERLRARLEVEERAELEASSSVECAASNHDRAPDAEVGT